VTLLQNEQFTLHNIDTVFAPIGLRGEAGVEGTQEFYLFFQIIQMYYKHVLQWGTNHSK